MVIVAQHGPFTWGAAAKKAVYNSVMLKEIAKMAYVTIQINPNASKLNKTLIDKHYERKHGRDAYYGQKQINLCKNLYKCRHAGLPLRHFCYIACSKIFNIIS